MGLSDYISRVYRKIFPDVRYRLIKEAQIITANLEDLLREYKESADSWDKLSFEHDLVLTRKDIAEAEMFIIKLSKHHLHRPADRIDSKIKEIKYYCETVRQRYKE